MPETKTFPIVGARYRPPAQVLLNHLAVGTALQLIAEPDNPYDPNAVAVWLTSTDIPAAAHDRLEEALPSAGSSLEQVLELEAWHLGYVPKEMAAVLRTDGTIGDEPIPATFSTSPTGAPRVRLEVEVEGNV